MIVSRAVALATLPLAAALGGCLDMMMEDAGPNSVLASPTEDPMDPEVRKTLPMVQQHGIYYEYPVWLDYKSGEEEWEAGYVWASLSYLPLIGNVGLYKDAPRDPVRFSDLVEGIEPISIIYMRVIGMDGNQKPRWSSQFNLNDHAQVHRIGQLNMGNAQIPCDVAGLLRQRAPRPLTPPSRSASATATSGP